MARKPRTPKSPIQRFSSSVNKGRQSKSRGAKQKSRPAELRSRFWANQYRKLSPHELELLGFERTSERYVGVRTKRIRSGVSTISKRKFRQRYSKS
jgi:hypothetical protein